MPENLQKVLITGGQGFVGRYLQRAYEDKCMAPGRDGLDVTNSANVNALISLGQFEVIHHLAARTYVPDSWKDPRETFRVNVGGTINVLEAVRKYSSHTIVHLVSSSEVYGNSKLALTDEDALLRPANPYAASKLAVENLGVQYNRAYGLGTIITRSFNHIGPGQGDGYVCSALAKQIADCEARKGGTIKVGNLDAVRDFTDVRDVIAAYLLAVRHCDYGTPYNICSGKGVEIKEILHRLLGMVLVRVDVEHDPAKMRPSDTPRLVGTAAKFMLKTGWKPHCTLQTTLGGILAYWSEKALQKAAESDLGGTQSGLPQA